MQPRYVCDPHISGQPQAWGWMFFPGSTASRCLFGKADVDLCRVPESRTFFDSLVSDFKRHTTCEIRDEQSQQKLNCALPTQVARLEDGPAQVCKNWGCDRFSLIKNFPKARKSRGNLNSRSDEPVSAYERRQIIEWSDFVGTVAVTDANFEASARVSHRFLRRV